jgi:hypothetical protein
LDPDIFAALKGVLGLEGVVVFDFEAATFTIFEGGAFGAKYVPFFNDYLAAGLTLFQRMDHSYSAGLNGKLALKGEPASRDL